MNNIWKGVLIEESLSDLSILPKLNIVSIRTTTLENEASRGKFHFHSVEVSPNNLEEVVKFITTNIKDGWYFHLVNKEEMIVMFYNKVFNMHKNNQEEIELARNYALSIGILREQLNLEKLFGNPFA